MDFVTALKFIVLCLIYGILIFELARFFGSVVLRASGGYQLLCHEVKRWRTRFRQKKSG